MLTLIKTCFDVKNDAILKFFFSEPLNFFLSRIERGKWESAKEEEEEVTHVDVTHTEEVTTRTEVQFFMILRSNACSKPYLGL